MKKIILILLGFSVFSYAQNLKDKTVKKHFPAEVKSENIKDDFDIKEFQNELNEEYKNPEKSPLRGENFKKFTAHPFFPINHKYAVNAKFVKTENAEYIDFPTTSGKTKKFKEFGKLYFKLNGKNLTLKVYQQEGIENMKGYEDHLFLPFRDLTAGKETYGGGKYLEVKIPAKDEIYLDFNKSYHPFCAYNAYDYNCPIVPKENWLNVRVEVGVKYDDIWFEH